MPLQPGNRIGQYRIIAPLGAGGMGEVYRATDSRLKRDVALKVLPPDVAADPDRLARFGREGSALVMELVEGQDLSARIERGSVPLADALPIARQIAEALEAAHERQ